MVSSSIDGVLVVSITQRGELAVDPEQGVFNVLGADAVADVARAFMDILDYAA
jgi:hypothetical protein